MNVYLTTIMVFVVAHALVVRLLTKDSALKLKCTLAALPILSVLASVQASVANVPSVSIAWWLLVAIFIVLFINTCISYFELKKEQKLEEEEEESEIEEIVDEKVEEKPNMLRKRKNLRLKQRKN